MVWSDLISVWLMGLLGTGHCLGMCGAFAAAAGAGGNGAGWLVARQFAYQLGKATSYAFVGLIPLFAGSMMCGGQGPTDGLQATIAWITGGLMVLTGVAFAIEVRLSSSWLHRWRGLPGCAAMTQLWRSPSLVKSALIGWVNGFLPCGLSLMALLYLTQFGSPWAVVGGAYAFGFGTLPGLLLAGWAGQRISLSTRRSLVRLAGAALVGFGVVTVFRGDPAVHEWMHTHLMPSMGDGNMHSH